MMHIHMNKSSLTAVINNVPYTMDKTNPAFVAAREAIRDKDEERFVSIFNRSLAIEKYSGGLVTVEGDQVYYKGSPINSTLSRVMMDTLREGFDITPFKNFVEKLMANPSKTAVNELYLFLDSGHIPISADGDIIAYKAVRGDYTDYRSHSFDNRVGSVHEMPRNEVDDDRNRTCSTGFHFCSLDYAKKFFHRPGGHLMLVKVNPADVVSIPNDYSNTKGRTWKYSVIGEHKEAYNAKDYSDAVPTSVYRDDKDTEDKLSPQEDTVINYISQCGYADIKSLYGELWRKHSRLYSEVKSLLGSMEEDGLIVRDFAGDYVLTALGESMTSVT